MSLLVSLRSETIKLKRTLSIYICLSAAAFATFMTFIENVDVDPNTRFGKPWTEYFLRGHEPLSFVLFPLYVILICTLLLQIEYRDKTWKQLLSSPQKLLHIFLAKFIVLQFMIIAFLVCHNLFMLISALAAEMMRPELFDGKTDIAKIAITNVQVYFLIAGMSAIQFWLSLRFRSFIASLAIGVGAWFSGAMMAFEYKWRMIEYYPYAFTILGAWSRFKANIVNYQWYSIITVVVFLGIAYAEFSKRKIRS
jgi:hypothetical protein